MSESHPMKYFLVGGRTGVLKSKMDISWPVRVARIKWRCTQIQCNFFTTQWKNGNVFLFSNLAAYHRNDLLVIFGLNPGKRVGDNGKFYPGKKVQQWCLSRCLRGFFISSDDNLVRWTADEPARVNPSYEVKRFLKAKNRTSFHPSSRTGIVWNHSWPDYYWRQ